MSFLLKNRKELSKEFDLAYELIDANLCRLINDVSQNPKFPKKAISTLYEFSGDAKGSKLALVSSLTESYALTKRDVKKVLTLKQEGDLQKLVVKNTTVEDFVDDIKETDPEYFEKVCNNLQRIIDKYKIEINPEKYE